MSEDWRNHLMLASTAGCNFLSSFFDSTSKLTVFSVVQRANYLAEVLSGEWRQATSVLCAFIRNSKAFFANPSAVSACTALAAACPPALLPVLQQIARVCSPSATPGDIVSLVLGLRAESEPAAELVARLHSSVRDSCCLQSSPSPLRFFW
jgi:hypothetical protein